MDTYICSIYVAYQNRFDNAKKYRLELLHLSKPQKKKLSIAEVFGNSKEKVQNTINFETMVPLCLKPTV